MISNEERIGNNIRGLRLAYGFTQDDLAESLYVTRNTISNYEQGIRLPKPEILELIAKHFMITVEELTTGDYSSMPPVNISKDAFWRGIDIVFPVVSTDKAMENDHFKKAYSIHKAVFDEIKRNSLDAIDELDECEEEYRLAADNNDSVDETIAANLLGIMLLMKFMLKGTPRMVKEKPAPIRQLMDSDDETAEIMNNPDPSLEKDAEEILNEFRDPETLEYVSKMKLAVKNSSVFSDLAYYYIALEYLYNLTDNGLSAEFNTRIGAEMLSSLIELENRYAIRFHQFQLEALGWKEDE